MNEEVQVRYRWTVAELLAAHRWHFRQRVRPWGRWALGALTAFFLLEGAYELSPSPAWFPGGYLLAVGVYIPSALFLIRPWRLRRQFAKRPDRDTEIEWRVGAETLHVQSAHGRSEFGWPLLAKVVQTPAGFLFYPNAQIFHWLPRHGFASEADFERLSQLARRHAAAFHQST